ncbi:hypothetical protein [Mycoplasma anserisalpingitidis]|uniref:hypothetical protein n=1 Tax=Mycoplasma anserisalpingitidis TaxID=519450 RepID=UPI0011B10ACC|nr:hypothetical protein [Mycoplasma anserisalpingitidis]QDY87725.1 hypothetical protein FOY45_02185 [Mycoplasma anserisalpingitidis]
MKTFFGYLTKSDNAILAEERGLKTLSNLPYEWMKRAVRAGAVEPTEWHHTSAAANKTYYYNLRDFWNLKESDFPAIKNKFNQPNLNKIKIKITYQKMVKGFSNRARRKTFDTFYAEGLDIRKSDNVIIGAGGRKLTSKNDEVEFFYKKKGSTRFTKIKKADLIKKGYKFVDEI